MDIPIEVRRVRENEDKEMHASETVLLALLIILIVVIVCQSRSRWMGDSGKQYSSEYGRSYCQPAGCREGMTGGSPAYYSNHPYAILNHQMDMRHGNRHDVHNQAHYLDTMAGADYHASGAHLMPQDVEKAMRESWFAAPFSDATTHNYDVDLGYSAGEDAMQYHQPEPGIDYDRYVTDLVVGPRMRENHSRWVQEMKPWSQGVLKVDTLEVENYLPFTGLRRPQPVAQYNPLQLTEVDTYDLARGANEFRFQG